jgi:hypothetical protein
MHSLNANKSGTVKVTLMQTSPANAKLNKLYMLQQANASLWGQNVIVIRSKNDVITATLVAFKKVPDLNYKKEGDKVEWNFDAGKIDVSLGEYA